MKRTGDEWLAQTDLFVSGADGYHTYRIPALAVSREGTMLAFCEGRVNGRGDAGEIHLMLRRSADGGRTWEPMRRIVADGTMTCGNPCPVVDARDGTIWLPFCKNLEEGDQDLILQGKAPRTVWMTHSRDDGVTWAEPVEITPDVKAPAWTWYATGPTHGIQLRSGRLLIPCDHQVGTHYVRDDPRHSHVIYSDDAGQSWHIGGIVDESTNESVAVEALDGSVYINCRNYGGGNRRAYAWSHDGGTTFGERRYDDALTEPVCQASMVRLSGVDDGEPGRVLFANPASTARERMTVRMSLDECRTWPIARMVHAGPAAYSDLAVAPDGTICLLYERGDGHPYERLTLARFSRAWLEAGDGPGAG
jgi:sialidase-1